MTWNAKPPMLYSPKMHFGRKTENSVNSAQGLRSRSWYARGICQKRGLTVRVSALVLSMAVVLEGAGLAQEPIALPEDFQLQVLDERGADAKAEVNKRGIGKKSKVRVKLRDKHELKGHITQIDEYSFELRVEPEWRDDIQVSRGTLLRIPYADVEKIRGPKSRPAKIAADVGMVVAAVTILAAIAVLKWNRSKHGCWS